MNKVKIFVDSYYVFLYLKRYIVILNILFNMYSNENIASDMLIVFKLNTSQLFLSENIFYVAYFVTRYQYGEMHANECLVTGCAQPILICKFAPNLISLIEKKQSLLSRHFNI